MNSRSIFFLLFAAVFAGLTACETRDRIVRIQTPMGELRARLYDSTPQHRDNFIKLVQAGFYDSLLFHRVIRDFMVQGGDPDSKHAPADSVLGFGGPGYELPSEIGAPAIRGALAAARLSDLSNPERRSNGSQFFIVQGYAQTDVMLDQLEKKLKVRFSPERRRIYKQKGGAPQIDGQYTVFGELISGFEVLDKIAAVPRDAHDRPLADIRMAITLEK